MTLTEDDINAGLVMFWVAALAGFFIQELRYYRPAHIVWMEKRRKGGGPSYKKVMVCEENGGSMGGCQDREDQNCYECCTVHYTVNCRVCVTFLSLCVVTPGDSCRMTPA